MQMSQIFHASLFLAELHRKKRFLWTIMSVLYFTMHVSSCKWSLFENMKEAVK